MLGLKLFLVGYPLFLIFDFFWLSLMKGFYQAQFKNFNQAIQLNVVAAALAYLVLTLGIIIFVIPKNNQFGLTSFLWGGLFGLVAYGVYDLSNMATIGKWSWKLTLVDMGWGFIVCGLVALILSFVSHKWF